MPTSRYERAARQAGYQVIAGVDEAGRGSLFGPVFAAAVVLDANRPIRGLDDSKLLAPERRCVLAGRIRERAIAWGVAAADAFEIDRLNILQASRLAMQRAVASLNAQIHNAQIRAARESARPATATITTSIAVGKSAEVAKSVEAGKSNGGAASNRIPGSAAAAAPARQTGCDYLLVDALKVDAPIAQRALIHGDSLCFSIAAASILAKTERDAALVAWDRVFPEYGFAHNKGYSTPDHLAALKRIGPTALHRFSFEPVRNLSRYEFWMGYPIPQQGELFECP